MHAVVGGYCAEPVHPWPCPHRDHGLDFNPTGSAATVGLTAQTQHESMYREWTDGQSVGRQRGAALEVPSTDIRCGSRQCQAWGACKRNTGTAPHRPPLDARIPRAILISHVRGSARSFLMTQEHDKGNCLTGGLQPLTITAIANRHAIFRAYSAIAGLMWSASRQNSDPQTALSRGKYTKWF